MKLNFTIIVAFLFILLSRVSGQTAGSLDVNFGVDGKYIYDKDLQDIYLDVKVQPDGKIVSVGMSLTPAYTPSLQVTRLLPNGTPDPSFATNGQYNLLLNSECGAYKCIIKADGKILIGGYTTNYTNYWMLLLQLNADGTPDLSFGTNGVALYTSGPQENYLFGLTLQEDGKILAAGYTQNSEYKNIPTVVRFSENGTLDASFGDVGAATIPVTETDNDFSAISVQSDGKIVAAGHISNGLSWFSLLVARFDQNGVLDPSYGTNGIVNMNLGNVDDEFYDMVMLDNNETILTGFTVSQADLNYHLLLMKLDNSGYPKLGFGIDGYVVWGDVPYTFGDAMTMQPDGKILVVGSTGELMPGNNDWAIWRFLPDGSLDNVFGTDGVTTTDFFGNADEALGIALHQDKIIVAGKTRNATNYLDFAVAQYNNDFHESLGKNDKVLNCTVTPNLVNQNGAVTLTFELKNSEDISVELINTNGSTISEIPLGKLSTGNHTQKIELPSSISAGVYYFRVKGTYNSFQSPKLVVSK